MATQLTLRWGRVLLTCALWMGSPAWAESEAGAGGESSLPPLSQGTFGSEFVFRTKLFGPYVLGTSAGISTMLGLGLSGNLNTDAVLLTAMFPYAFALGFTGPDLVHPLHRNFWMRKAERLSAKRGFEVQPFSEGFFEVIYPDGFWFEVRRDPLVIETSAKPMTVEEAEANRERLQRDLFDLARSSGVAPPRTVIGAGGHVNIGLNNFEGDLRLFRNFLVDIINHYEFSEGIFQYDSVNARTLRGDKGVRERFARLLADYDEGRFKTIEKFAEAFHNEVLQGKGRSYAISVRKAFLGKEEDRLIEVRAHRAQKDAQEFVDLIRMHAARIEYLRRRDGLVAFENAPPSRNPHTKLARFRRYIEETGLNWDRYRKLVPLRRRASAHVAGAAGALCSWAWASVRGRSSSSPGSL